MQHVVFIVFIVFIFIEHALDDATLAAFCQERATRRRGERDRAGAPFDLWCGHLDKLRDADGLRPAGLAPAASTPAPAPLTADAMAAVAALYSQLASAGAVGGAEAKDANLALASVLAPRLGMCTITCSRPAFKPGASFSLRSRAAVAAAPTVPSAAPPPSLPSQPKCSVRSRASVLRPCATREHGVFGHEPHSVCEVA